MKKFLTLALAAAMFVMPLAACDATSAEESAQAQSNGTFVVGFDAEFPPMGFIADDGSYTGFDLDIATSAYCLGFQGPGARFRQHRLYLERFHHQRP